MEANEKKAVDRDPMDVILNISETDDLENGPKEIINVPIVVEVNYNYISLD